MSIEIRETRPEDYAETERVIREAFWNVFKPGSDDHWLIHLARDWDTHIPQLDLVAIDGDRIVGNILSRKASILGDDGKTYITVRLGPIGVLPEYQRRGIGAQLLSQTASRAKATDFQSIILFGDPDYYLKHGYQPAEHFGIRNNKNYYLIRMHALELVDGALVPGRYAPLAKYVFNAKQFKAFDKNFPRKEVVFDTPSQLRYKELCAVQQKHRR